jgi:hypothetical protein
MKAFGAFVEHYVVGLPVMFGLATLSYAVLIWMALSKKDFVKAKIWHRSSGFSIEAGPGRSSIKSDDKRTPSPV